MMNQFCDALGRVLHRPSRLLVPGFALHTALGNWGCNEHGPTGHSGEGTLPGTCLSLPETGTGLADDHDEGIKEGRTGSSRSVGPRQLQQKRSLVMWLASM